MAFIESTPPQTVLRLISIADAAERARDGLKQALYYADTWNTPPDGNVMLVPSIATLDDARKALTALDAALGEK